jgi:hypothetical protein
MSRLAALPAATALLLSSAVSVSADPGPADPGGVTPVAATVPGPAGPAAPPPVGAGPPPVDDGRIASSPPATSTLEGVTLTISSSNETVTPIAPLTTAVSTREYVVGGLFTGSIAGASAPPEGVFEVGYQIGCGIDMSTSGGVLLGGNAYGGASLDVLGTGVLNPILGLPITIPGVPPVTIPALPPALAVIGAGGGFSGQIAVSLKPGIINTVPVTKKSYKGAAPAVEIAGFRVKIDGCVGESFIRSYAILARSTDERETILSWYGATKAV